MNIEVTHKKRYSTADAHYSGGLIDGAAHLKAFGDVATEILIRYDGDEGLFRAYSTVEFPAPVYAGDFIEYKGKLVKTGNTSREMEFEAWKIITPKPDLSITACEVLKQPVLVCKAKGTCVTPKSKQYITHV